MSEEWGVLSPERIGKATASRIKDVVATLKNGSYGASRDKYRTQLVIERLTGVMAPGYQNAAMLWGVQNEELARTAYELETGNDVAPGGFIIHPKIPMAGASPDGLIDDDGLLEIKCPESHTHHATLKSDKIDSTYIPQVQWQLACSKRQWVDWCSYDPRFPEEHRLFVYRVQKDHKYIAELEEEVRKFLAEVEGEVEWFRKRK